MLFARRLPIGDRCCLALLLVSVIGATPLVTAQDSKLNFDRDVRPVLTKRCHGCHGPKEPMGDFRMDMLNADLLGGADAETWHDILNKLNLGEMPPDDAPPLTDTQRRVVVDWLSAELRQVAEVRQATGGQLVLRRLTRYEYANTMRDLLGVDLDYAADFPPESNSEDGFQNNGADLGISPLQIELFLEAARKGLRKAIVVGPKPKVYSHRAAKSEKVRRVKGEVSSRLKLGERFLVRMDEFPREGQVRIRVRASAVAATGEAYPRMRIAMGLRADVKAPEKNVAVVDVTNDEDNPQTYEFIARIEDFPLPGKNPKFPGLQITIYNGLETDKPGKKIKQPKLKQPLKQERKKGKKSNSAKEPANRVAVDSVNGESVIVIESVEFEGPVLTSWPPASHSQIFFDTRSSTEEEYVAEVLRRFLYRAYRHPPSDSDVAMMLTFYRQLRPEYKTLAETVREVLALALVSPKFLYLVEPEPKKAKRRRSINDYELASRLSYFLWSTMPDERLFELAESGQLQQDSVLAAEVRRMLADPKSRQFVQHFTNQWFDLGAVDRIAVNPEHHPNFDDSLKADMRTETQLFFGVILDEDLSCLQLLDSDFAMLNRSLAEHYGLSGPRGAAFERVALTADNHRGGLLAQGSFLLANSNGEDSHPIKRAVWLLDRLLDSPPAQPPPDVPGLDPEQAELAGLPLKQQLEIHRKKPACNDCHRRIDPWGIALENYDAVGRWRTELKPGKRRKGKRRPPAAAVLDTSATLPGGTRVEGLVGLKKVLLSNHRQRFVRSLVTRLLTYGLGRTLDLSDREAIDTLTAQFVNDDYRLSNLLVKIVQSEPFQTK